MSSRLPRVNNIKCVEIVDPEAFIEKLTLSLKLPYQALKNQLQRQELDWHTPHFCQKCLIIAVVLYNEMLAIVLTKIL